MNDKNSVFEIGQNSLEVFQIIVMDNEEISHVRVISHNVCINWRQINSSERAKIDNLKEGLEHYLPDKDKWYPRENFLGLKLEKLETLGDNEVWSINSKIRLDNDPFGDFKHIPMMNFHFEDGVGVDDAVEAINKICEGKNGVLLKSGKFFHYYGNFLLYHQKWLHFLGQFLMPCVLVSPRYIGHALNDGYCSLRLTADKIFKPKIPTVVHVFN